MIFNHESKKYFRVLRGRDRPAWAEVERHLVESSQLPGAHLSHSKKNVRIIRVPFYIRSESISELQKVKEDMANWLVHDEPKELVFKDEPERVYYALVNGTIELEEISHWGDGILEFVCPDPFKYAKNEKVIKLTDSATVENKGSEITYPKFKMVAKKASTFAMINNPNDEYMLLGIPTEVEEKEVEERTLILDEQGDTLSLWTAKNKGVDRRPDASGNAKIDGGFIYDGTGIVVGSYGTGSNWHGPAVTKAIPATQDFEIEMMLRANQTNAKQTFRIEFYMLDESMNVLGKMAIVNRSATSINFVAEGRFGDFVNAHVNYPISSKNYLKREKHFHGMLRVKRIGSRFEFYVARTGASSGGRHYDTLTKSFNDVLGLYQGKLRYVQMHIGKFGNTANASLPRINSLRVYRHNKVTVDQTPYVVRKGDVIEFDHAKESILVNGENAMHIKNFGANFFGLNSGLNTLTVSPEGTFDTEISYRERYK